MNVIPCTSADAARWDDFVARCDEGSFYHLFAWKAINERCFGHETFYLAAVDGQELHGVLPLVLLRSRIFGRILCSMPFVNLGGPCAPEPQVLGALLDESRAVLDRTRARFLEIRAREKLGDEIAVSAHKVSMTVALREDPDAIWKAFTSKHRNNIRRAYGHGFTTVIGGAELLDACYDILLESWRSLGTPLYAKSYFRAILDAFGSAVAIFLVLHDGKPVGTAFNGHHRATVEGMWAGTRTAFRGSDCNYVLYWEMIKHYCEAGFERFHLGRSTVDSGAEAFKKKWLAEATQLYWHHIPGSERDIPQLNKENPKFRLAIQAWRRLPIAVTRRVGPMIARGIP